FTNTELSNLSSTVLTYTVIDHLPTLIFLRNSRIFRRRNIRTYRSFDTQSCQRFIDSLESFDWSPLYLIRNANDAYNYFIKVYSNIYNTCFPKTVYKQNKRIRKPYITADLIKRMNIRNQLYKSFLRSKNPQDLQIYKQYRNEITREITQRKRQFTMRMFENIDTKKMWNRLNELVFTKAPSTIPNKIIEGNNVYTEEALANRFNSFFSNIADNLNIEQNHNFECFDSPSDIFLSSFGNVTVEDIIKYINTLKSNSIGTDDICIKSIRLAKHVISEQLSYVINLSLLTSTFPDKLKTARLAILFKQGDRNSLNNYRPISI